MGFFSKISKAFKKVVKVSTGGLIGGHSNSGQSTTEETVPAPELGLWMQIRLTLLNQNQRSNS